MTETAATRIDFVMEQNTWMKAALCERDLLEEFQSWVQGGADPADLTGEEGSLAGATQYDDAGFSSVTHALMHSVQHAPSSVSGGDGDSASLIAARRTSQALIVPHANSGAVHVLPQRAILLVHSDECSSFSGLPRGFQGAPSKLTGKVASAGGTAASTEGSITSGSSGSRQVTSSDGSGGGGSRSMGDSEGHPYGPAGKRQHMAGHSRDGAGVTTHNTRGGGKVAGGGSTAHSVSGSFMSHGTPTVLLQGWEGHGASTRRAATTALLLVPAALPASTSFFDVGEEDYEEEDEEDDDGMDGENADRDGPEEDEMVSDDDMVLQWQATDTSATVDRIAAAMKGQRGLFASTPSLLPRASPRGSVGGHHMDAEGGGRTVGKAHGAASGGTVALTHAPALVSLCNEDYQLMQLVASAQQYFIITDAGLPDHPIAFASAGFHTLTGYSRNEILGFNCRFLQGPETDQSTVSRIRAAVTAGKDCRAVVLNYTKRGTPFWNELFIAPLKDASGRTVHFVGVQTAISADHAAKMLKLAALAAIGDRETERSGEGLLGKRVSPTAAAAIASSALRGQASSMTSSLQPVAVRTAGEEAEGGRQG